MEGEGMGVVTEGEMMEEEEVMGEVVVTFKLDENVDLECRTCWTLVIVDKWRWLRLTRFITLWRDFCDAL
jgi:hypothetical protein